MTFAPRHHRPRKNAAPLESPEVDPSEAALAISIKLPRQDLDVSRSKSRIGSSTKWHLEGAYVHLVVFLTFVVVFELQILGHRLTRGADGF